MKKISSSDITLLQDNSNRTTLGKEMTQSLITSGMRTFTVIWLGQIVSLIGSGITEFALRVWVYQHTGSVTQFALISLFASIPRIMISPIAGVLVDRWDRRSCMIISDSASGLGAAALTVLFFGNWLQIWHIYLVVGAISIFNAFQLPAYTATIALLVPKQNLSRANGMVESGFAAAQILSPLLAGLLIANVQLWNILLIDFISFIFALLTLLNVRFPKPQSNSQSKLGEGSLLREATFGWNYIRKRHSLLGLLMVMSVAYFTFGIVEILFTPLILSFASTTFLGVILTIGGCGWLLGSVVISIKGGPKRLIYGVLGFMLLQGFVLLLAGLKISVPLAAIGIFGYLFSYPVIASCNQAIWQSKIATNVQGRVFAVRLMSEWSLVPLAYIIAGPLADRVFEPMLTPNGLLAGSIGRIIGVGNGRGIALLFILVGMLNIFAVVAAYQFPPLRLVDDELPDS